MARLIIALLLVSNIAPGRTAPAQTQRIIWKNIAPTYKTFAEIKPVLINLGTRSIFLSRIYPYGYAQLERYYEPTGKWERGSWGMGCGTVAQAMVPIEIKPHRKHRVEVYWQISADDWDHPKHFVVDGTADQRPLNGKYRFILRYGLTPWTLAQHPAEIFVAESSEFLIKP